MSVVDWATDETGRRISDGTGRPIIANRYFDVAFEAAPDCQAGYLELYTAIARLQLPLAHGSVSVRLPAANLEHLVEDVDSLGFEWVATLAALLLDRPVMVVGDQPPPLADRIRCLDAVVALLPYGLRANLVAGTWTPNAAEHEIDLGFADGANNSQFQVGWQQLPALPALSASTARYLEEVQRQQRRNGTDWLVRRLWQHTAPLPLAPDEDVAAAVLRVLENEDLPHAVYHRIQSRTAVAGEARAALASTDPAELPAEIRLGLLRQVAVDGDEQDLHLLDRLWSGEVGAVLGEAVASTAAEPVAARYVALLARRPELTAMRHRWVRDAAHRPDPAAHVRMARILAASPPPAEDDTTLRALVLQNHTLCLELAVTVANRADEPAIRWLRWLADGTPDPSHPTPDWLRPFGVAVGARPAMQHADAVSLALWGARALLAVLCLARARDTLPQTLPVLTPELLRAAEQPEARASIGRLLTGIATQSAATQAFVDLLLAACESFEGAARPVDDADAYASVAADLLRRLFTPDRRRMATVQLVRGLTGPRHQRSGLLVATALADRLRPDELHRHVLVAVLPAVEETPALLLDLPAVMQDELVEMSPALRERAVLERISAVLATCTEDDDKLDEVAELWRRALLLGCSVESVLQRLRAWPGVTAIRLYDLVYLLVIALTRPEIQPGARAADRVAQHVHEAVLGEAMGAEMAAEYRDVLVDAQEGRCTGWRSAVRCGPASARHTAGRSCVGSSAANRNHRHER
ncbi:hypothetical protein GCM10027610_051950 [Dactylosporangium cerinum]